MLTTNLRRFINYGSACLRATFRRLRNRILYNHDEIIEALRSIEYIHYVEEK